MLTAATAAVTTILAITLLVAFLVCLRTLARLKGRTVVQFKLLSLGFSFERENPATPASSVGPSPPHHKVAGSYSREEQRNRHLKAVRPTDREVEPFE